MKNGFVWRPHRFRDSSSTVIVSFSGHTFSLTLARLVYNVSIRFIVAVDLYTNMQKASKNSRPATMFGSLAFIYRRTDDTRERYYIVFRCRCNGQAMGIKQFLIGTIRSVSSRCGCAALCTRDRTFDDIVGDMKDDDLKVPRNRREIY